jgi:glycerophosphoryl diester phosphodiesterase
MKGRALLLILMVTLIAACKKETLEIDNLHGKILATGHGGCGFQSYSNPYPTNSMSSITRAIDGLGADGVEVDVQMTIDKKLVLYHNETLESATGCSGCIPGRTADEVLSCRYNKDFNVSLADEPLILLETVLQHYSGYSQKPLIYLDLRDDNPCDPAHAPNLDTLANEVVKMVQKYNGASWVYVIANTTSLLEKVRKLDPSLKLYLDGNAKSSSLPEAVSSSLQGYVVSNDDITAQQVQYAHENGLEVVIFGTKTREGIISAVKKSPDAIQADNLELLLEVLRD